VPLLDRVQITGDRQPTGEEWNRLQTNIERALRKLHQGTTSITQTSNTVINPATASTQRLLSPLVADGGDADSDGGLGMFPLPGPQGRAGRDGRDGARGLDGDDGEDSFIPGPPGPQGRVGVGLMGPPGFDGDDGEDAIFVPGPAGRSGRDGRDGAPGWDGDDPEEPILIVGPRGPTGATGPAGPAGTGGGTGGMPWLGDIAEDEPESAPSAITLSATSFPALTATFITQTPSAHLPNEQALSALASGVMQSLTATGVVSTFAVGSGRIPHGSGSNGHLTDSANLTFASSTLTVSTATPLVLGAGATGVRTSIRDPDNLANFAQAYVYPNSGTNVGQSINIIPRGTGFSATLKAQLNIFNTDLVADGTNFEWAGFRTVGTDGIVIGTGSAGAGTSNRKIMFASGWFTDGTTNANQFVLNTDGSVDMVSLAAGGIVKAAVTSGKLSIAVAGTDYQPAITWPTAAQVLISSGTNTVPVGDASFTYNTGTDTLTAGSVNVATAATIGGTTTANVASILQTNASANQPAWNVVANSSAGAAAQCAFLLTNAQNNVDNYFVFSLHGTGYTTSGLLAARVGRIELSSNASPGNLIIGNASASGDIVLYTTASRTERMRIATGGNVSVANLTAGGVAYATAATGVLKIGTSSEVAAAITWPAADRVLVSNGTNVAPIGYANFTYDGSSLALASGSNESWYNVDGANYERVRAFWSSNVWNLAAEHSGATLRNIVVSAANVKTTATAGTNEVYGSSAVNVATVLGTNPDVVLSTTQVRLRGNLTGASSASFALDAINVEGTLVLTGSTNVTAAAGVNMTKFAIPSYNGGGVAKTVTHAATVNIDGAPLGVSSLTITNAYALRVQGGTTLLQGNLTTEANVIVGGGGMTVGFYGNVGTTRPNVSGSKGGNAALASLISALLGQALISDSTT
jgi:hypothetical protein